MRTMHQSKYVQWHLWIQMRNGSIWTNIKDEPLNHGERSDIHKAYIKQIEMEFSTYKIINLMDNYELTLNLMIKIT